MGKGIETFLTTLDRPMKLNEMRVMKEANYIKFRQMLSDVFQYGDDILAMLNVYYKQFGLSKKAYNVVYEGFWDLYCKKPHNIVDLPVKKLEGFLQRVKLIVPPSDVPDDDGLSVATSVNLPLKAIVRIRIPLIRPVPQAPAEIPEG